MPGMPGRYLTLAQVADRLDLAELEVYAAVRAWGLPALWFGGRGSWRVEAGRLQEWLSAAR
jgi:hypothetical protein